MSDRYSRHDTQMWMSFIVPSGRSRAISSARVAKCPRAVVARTATELHKINADQYAYFVQSIESRFYPDVEKPLHALVDSTYELGLPVVTEATWIQEYLQQHHATFRNAQCLPID